MGALTFALDLSSSHKTLLLQDDSIFKPVCCVLPAFMLRSVWEKVARSVVLERPFTDGGTVVVCAANTLAVDASISAKLCLLLFYCSVLWEQERNGACRRLGWREVGCVTAVQVDTPSGGAMGFTSVILEYIAIPAKVCCAHVAGISSAAVTSWGNLL